MKTASILSTAVNEFTDGITTRKTESMRISFLNRVFYLDKQTAKELNFNIDDKKQTIDFEPAMLKIVDRTTSKGNAITLLVPSTQALGFGS